MRNGYTQQQICLMNQLQQLWAQHVYWTRLFIISTAAGLDDLALLGWQYESAFAPCRGLKEAASQLSPRTSVVTLLLLVQEDSHTIHLPVQKPLRPLFLQDRFLQANLAAQHL